MGPEEGNLEVIPPLGSLAAVSVLGRPRWSLFVGPSSIARSPPGLVRLGNLAENLTSAPALGSAPTKAPTLAGLRSGGTRPGLRTRGGSAWEVTLPTG